MNFKTTCLLGLVALLMPVSVFAGKISVFGAYNSGDALVGKVARTLNDDSESYDMALIGDKNSMGIGIEYIDRFKSNPNNTSSFKYAVGLLFNSLMEYDQVNALGKEYKLPMSLQYSSMYINLMYELSTQLYVLGGINISTPQFDDADGFVYPIIPGQVAVDSPLEDKGGFGYQVGAGYYIRDNLSAEVLYEHINMSATDSGAVLDASTDIKFSFHSVRFSVKYLFEFDVLEY